MWHTLSFESFLLLGELLVNRVEGMPWVACDASPCRCRARCYLGPLNPNLCGISWRVLHRNVSCALRCNYKNVKDIEDYQV
jgi:hypothetical protein